MYTIVGDTLKALKNGEDAFEAMLKAHTRVNPYANSNHALRDNTSQPLISREEVFKRIMKTSWGVRDYRGICFKGPVLSCWQGY